MPPKGDIVSVKSCDYRELIFTTICTPMPRHSHGRDIPSEFSHNRDHCHCIVRVPNPESRRQVTDCAK